MAKITHVTDINLNTAEITDLRKIYNIDAVRASHIIDRRNERGGKFNCVDDLIEVYGIGEKMLETIKNDPHTNLTCV